MSVSKVIYFVSSGLKQSPQKANRTWLRKVSLSSLSKTFTTLWDHTLFVVFQLYDIKNWIKKQISLFVVFQFMDLIELCEKEPSLENLLGSFNNQNVSDYVVVYLRLLTSGYLQREHIFFQHFIEGGRSVKEFCQQVGVWILWWNNCQAACLTEVVQTALCLREAWNQIRSQLFRQSPRWRERADLFSLELRWRNVRHAWSLPHWIKMILTLSICKKDINPSVGCSYWCCIMLHLSKV